MEVASERIGVSLVEPGSFDTGIWGEAEAEMESRRGPRYEEAYRRSLAQVRLSRPIRGAPERVAGLIGSALTSRNPRPRYLVGPDARLLALAERLAPTAVRDRVKRLVLGL
jgi:NAD(P)-dependent dehydrogenase (short-subunit alcohol dehydrogenase family)